MNSCCCITANDRSSRLPSRAFSPDQPLWSHVVERPHCRETDTEYPNKDDRGKKGQPGEHWHCRTALTDPNRKIIWGQSVPHASLPWQVPKLLTASLLPEHLHTPCPAPRLHPSLSHVERRTGNWGWGESYTDAYTLLRANTQTH